MASNPAIMRRYQPSPTQPGQPKPPIYEQRNNRAAVASQTAPTPQPSPQQERDADGMLARDGTRSRAIARIQHRTIDDLDLGDGAGTSQIEQSGRHLANTPQGRVSDPGSYTGASQAAGYINQLQKTLGIKGPQDTSQATKDAAFQELDREAYMGAIRDQGNLARQGQSTGARSQALSALRGTELAGQRAQVGASIDQDAARQMQAYEQALLGAAQNQGQNMSQYGLSRANQLTNASFDNARLQAARESERAQNQMQTGIQMNDEEYRRRIAEYQNALDQINQKNTADMLDLEEANRKSALRTQIFGDVLSAGAGIASKFVKPGG